MSDSGDSTTPGGYIVMGLIILGLITLGYLAIGPGEMTDRLILVGTIIWWPFSWFISVERPKTSPWLIAFITGAVIWLALSFAVVREAIWGAIVSITGPIVSALAIVGLLPGILVGLIAIMAGGMTAPTVSALWFGFSVIALWLMHQWTKP